MSLPSICFVLPNIYPVLSGSRVVKFVGGAELQHSIAAKALAKAGYRVSVVCLDHDQADGEVIDGVRVFKSHKLNTGLPVLRFCHPNLTGTWQAMVRADADVYYQPCAAFLTGVVAAFCRFHKRKSVFAGQSDTDFQPDKLRLSALKDKAMFRWGLRHVDAIVAQTPKQQRMSADHLGRLAALVPNGYELPGKPVNNKREYVLWVGNIRTVKRPERFLEIARSLPHVRFRMIGGPKSNDGGTSYEVIKTQATKIPNLEFLGFLPYAETEPHFDHAAVFVNTSDVEGFPNTFLQAWARGVPTVSYFDPDLDEEGVFLKVDAIPQAVSAIERLMSDEGMWRTYSERSKSYFSHHHAIDAIVSRYANLFDQLLEGSAR